MVENPTGVSRAAPWVPESPTWWQRGVFYQIYPRSFRDASGDGLGDLRGILERVDYLAWLGVDAIWLSPIYPSEDVDLGYDVSDYCAVDSRLGTLADFDRLLDALHDRGIKLVLDLVPNHTSDRHPWFLRRLSYSDLSYSDLTRASSWSQTNSRGPEHTASSRRARR